MELLQASLARQEIMMKIFLKPFFLKPHKSTEQSRAGWRYCEGVTDKTGSVVPSKEADKGWWAPIKMRRSAPLNKRRGEGEMLPRKPRACSNKSCRENLVIKRLTCPSLQKGCWERSAQRGLLSQLVPSRLRCQCYRRPMGHEVLPAAACLLRPLQASPMPVQWEGLNTCFWNKYKWMSESSEWMEDEICKPILSHLDSEKAREDGYKWQGRIGVIFHDPPPSTSHQQMGTWCGMGVLLFGSGVTVIACP